VQRRIWWSETGHGKVGNKRWTSMAFRNTDNIKLGRQLAFISRGKNALECIGFLYTSHLFFTGDVVDPTHFS